MWLVLGTVRVVASCLGTYAEQREITWRLVASLFDTTGHSRNPCGLTQRLTSARLYRSPRPGREGCADCFEVLLGLPPSRFVFCCQTEPEVVY